jgi:hypothetical protein
MRSLRSRLAALLVALVVLIGTTASVMAGSANSGGPWSYTRQGVVCSFSGSHNAANGQAYGQTNDFNGGCGKLMVRLKYNPGGIDSGWKTSVTEPAIFQWFAPASTTAVSSEHRAQNPFDLTFSGIQRPHAW